MFQNGLSCALREPPAHAARLFCTLKIWPEIGRKYRPIYRFLTNVPAANYLKINLRLLLFFHGMEDVGSIPTRSTNLFNTNTVSPRIATFVTVEQMSRT